MSDQLPYASISELAVRLGEEATDCAPEGIGIEIHAREEVAGNNKLEVVVVCWPTSISIANWHRVLAERRALLDGRPADLSRYPILSDEAVKIAAHLQALIEPYCNDHLSCEITFDKRAFEAEKRQILLDLKTAIQER